MNIVISSIKVYKGISYLIIKLTWGRLCHISWSNHSSKHVYMGSAQLKIQIFHLLMFMRSKTRTQIIKFLGYIKIHEESQQPI